MNAEELELCEKLNDFFDDKMGPIIPGDRLYVYDSKKINVVLRRDDFWDTIELDTGVIHAGISGYCYNKNVVRLPLPIDPVNPERGLWGMVDWERWCALGLKDSFEIHDNTLHFESDTPTLALLKALEAQEKV